MSEYISREAAIAETRKPRLTDAELRRRLASIPAADVQPVVRGTWIVGKSKWNDSLNSYTCPICGSAFQDIGPENFCANCGADMRESKQESKQVGILEEES